MPTEMYTITDFAKLHHISTIIWDIDGTITDPTGEVNHEVAAKIINLALDGVYHLFITGRDAAWIIRYVINPMKRFYGFARTHDNMIFFAEVGCVVLTVDDKGNVTESCHQAVKDHPLALNKESIRDALKSLTYNPEQLNKFQGQNFNPVDEQLIYDADRVGWIASRTEKPRFDQHIWSIYKKVFATFENLRDENGKPLYFDQKPWADQLKEEIKNRDLNDQVDVEIVSTALNIVPKIDSVRLGKSWAAGVALKCLWEEKLGKTFTLDEIVNRAIAFGDGKADFDFTIPHFEPLIMERLEHTNIQIVFVGEEEDMPSETDLTANMIITATGGGDLVFVRKKQVIELHPIKGAMVVSSVLDFLKQWGYFRSF